MEDELKEVNLVTNGSKIRVDNSKKGFYIKSYLRWSMLKRIQRPLQILRDVIKEIIGPLDKITAAFTPNELVRLLCGERTVDVQDWYDHTRYIGDINHNSESV